MKHLAVERLIPAHILESVPDVKADYVKLALPDIKSKFRILFLILSVHALPLGQINHIVRQIFNQHIFKFIRINRFCQIILKSLLQIKFPCSRHRISRQRNDRCVLGGIIFQPADCM